MSMPSEPKSTDAQDFIPLNVPQIQGNEWKYIKECLDTNWVSSVGEFVDRFETEVAEKVGDPATLAEAVAKLPQQDRQAQQGNRQQQVKRLSHLVFGC